MTPQRSIWRVLVSIAVVGALGHAPLRAQEANAARDAGVAPDAGPPDAGPPDAGPSDAGPSDAGPPDAGAAQVAVEVRAAPSAPLTLPAEALVAVIGGRTPGAGRDVVLLSDVQLIAVVALARAGAHDAEPTTALLQSALEQIVGELLIRREAMRLGAVAPSPDDVALQRAAIERSIGGAAVLESLLVRLGAGRDEVDVLAERRAVVERFLSANLAGASEVTEADIVEAYTNASHPFVGRPLDEVRDALRAWLRVTLVDAYVARWLATLRGRTDVHVLRPFVRQTPVGASSSSGERSDVGTR